MLLSFSIITACSAVYSHTQAQGAGRAVMAFLFIYFGFYDIAFTGLTLGYPLEILPFSLRAKGMALFNFFVSCALFFVSEVIGGRRRALMYLRRTNTSTPSHLTLSRGSTTLSTSVPSASPSSASTSSTRRPEAECEDTGGFEAMMRTDDRSLGSRRSRRSSMVLRRLFLSFKSSRLSSTTKARTVPTTRNRRSRLSMLDKTNERQTYYRLPGSGLGKGADFELEKRRGRGIVHSSGHTGCPAGGL
jgi:hypothetical protein